jgi:carbonic anhydrase
MEELQRLFEGNQKWVEEMKSSDPDFFKRLAEQQKPEILWIGCSDSRVPANQIINMLPGEVFVHRNIANQVIISDINCQSVIQFAVEFLKVKHIIVCGHYGCGGIIASLEGKAIEGVISEWLIHIKSTYQQNIEKFDDLKSNQERVSRLCELNVEHQVVNLRKSAPVIKAWNQGQSLKLHGCIYNIEDGVLKDLKISVSGP